MTSYFLSRTLVPTMVRYLLRAEAHPDAADGAAPHAAKKPHLGGRFLAAFERGFETLRDSYGRVLALALEHRGIAVSAFAAVVAASLCLLPLVGEDFFPTVDAGLIKLHVRGSPGTRIEETEQRFAAIESTVKGVIPPREIDTMLDILGTPYSGLNLSLSEGALVSSADGQIYIALRPGHAPTAEYMHMLRAELHRAYPDTTFFFLAPDISTQVLNFGIAAPIDVQILGGVGKEAETYSLAQSLADRIARIPGTADVHLAQVVNRPELRVDVNRTMAQGLGLTERDVANDLLVSLSSSGQVSPSYWLDPKRGVQYLVAVQTPQPVID